MDFLESFVYDRPPLVLVHGPRGGGKTYLAGLATHCDSMSYPGHATMSLGGSEAQSSQMYQALRDFQFGHGVSIEPIVAFNLERATYDNGSTVQYIPASRKSVHGPHIPTLRLDEVDEIDPDVRESSLGMCMDMGGMSASISMTSTYHRVSGPMKELLERGEAGDFPVFRFCAFEVLERCPEERSGSTLEHCPECPLMKWCHSDRDTSHALEQTMDLARRGFLEAIASIAVGLGLPKAKRSRGHYTIDSLIQKVRGVSDRVFESDYLCTGPRADGVWFTQFSDADNITEAAEFDPMLPVFVSIDSGVHTGAVLLQYRTIRNGHHISVCDEYFSEGLTAESSAVGILGVLNERCGSVRRFVSTDSSGGARNPVGPSVIAEYERCGLRGERGIEQWSKYPGCVTTGLATIESMIRSADGTVWLTIHPRCKMTIAAFKGYIRAKRQNQWQDYPEDPQHPHEDMIDPIRGALSLLMPEGRKPQPMFTRRKVGAVL